jgi:hypothetical protein
VPLHYATEDDFHLAHYGQATVRASHGFDEEHVKCTAHQIPNEFRIAYSSAQVIVLSQG